MRTILVYMFSEAFFHSRVTGACPMIAEQKRLMSECNDNITPSYKDEKQFVVISNSEQ